MKRKGMVAWMTYDLDDPWNKDNDIHLEEFKNGIGMMMLTDHADDPRVYLTVDESDELREVLLALSTEAKCEMMERRKVKNDE